MSNDESVDVTSIILRQERIGKGTFGNVYRAIDKRTGSPIALKIIDLDSMQDDIDDIRREIATLIGGGSVLELLAPGPLDESYVAIVLRETLKALAYLHSQNIVHRDIKAANILVASSGNVKVADFGVSLRLGGIEAQNTESCVGSPFWMAPEIINGTSSTTACDLWSLGITAIEMAMGEPPKADLDPMRVVALIPKEPPPSLHGSQFSEHLREFVSLALTKEEARRPTARELLKHRLVSKAKKNSKMLELIERRRVWESSAPSSSAPSEDGGSSITDEDRAPDSQRSAFRWTFAEDFNETNSTVSDISTSIGAFERAHFTDTNSSDSVSMSSEGNQVIDSSMLGSNQLRHPALRQVMYPALSALLEQNRHQPEVVEALAHVKIALDRAESAKPGITHALLSLVLEKLRRPPS